MFDIRQLIGGIGMFLFGMDTFEESIKKMSGKKLKLLVQKFTNTTFKSILSGTIVTGITQNSGIVSLLVLAFVSGGVMQLHNAIGVIIGANLGGTLDSLVISYIGFGDFNIAKLGLPCIGIGGLMMLLTKKETLQNIAKLLIGFGLIFVGIAFMKESVEHLKDTIDLSVYKHVSLRWFFLIGTVVSTILQSSSAAIILGLTALSTNIITFPAVCVIMMGANIGTTSTGLIASLGGKSIKKQVARSHVLFNVILAGIGGIFLGWYTWLVMDVMKYANNPVMGAAVFNFVYKLSGVFIFAPFMKQYAALLRWLIPEDIGNSPLQIEQFSLTSKKDITLISPLLIALENDCKKLISKVYAYNVFVYGIDPERIKNPQATLSDIKEHLVPRDKELHKEMYQEVLRIADIMLEHLLPIKRFTSDKEDSDQLNRIEQTISYCTQSAKSTKNIYRDIQDIREAQHELTDEMYQSLLGNTTTFYLEAADFLPDGKVDYKKLFSTLTKTYQNIETYHTTFMSRISKQIAGKFIEEIHIPSMMNVSTYSHESIELMYKAIFNVYVERTENL